MIDPDQLRAPRTKRMAAGIASHVALHSKPFSPQVHVIPGLEKNTLYVPNGSQLFDASEQVALRLTKLIAAGDEEAISKELIALGIDAPPLISDVPLTNPPLRALSLAIAQKCNMGCSYCYADQGGFGGPSKNMPLETALKSIDMLVSNCDEGGKAHLTFLGGEPLFNRDAIRKATEYAVQQAVKRNIQFSFSITTNGTLLRESDGDFFEKHGFAVTVSLDGLKSQHNSRRPMKNGDESYDRIIRSVEPLLKRQKKMQVSARVTVSPNNLDLVKTLDEFIALGFHSVGFSPLLRSNAGTGEMTKRDLDTMLAEMIECGLNFERHVLAGKRYPFLNMINALKEISKGTHRPYPCGAGAGYLGVSADGELAACHRFVNEPHGRIGNLDEGVIPALQNKWLSDRHVHRQEPCNKCWARYLCGGGCHHEVLSAGRNACDYIRGWLYYSIQAYGRISNLAPDYFQVPQA